MELPIVKNSFWHYYYMGRAFSGTSVTCFLLLRLFSRFGGARAPGRLHLTGSEIAVVLCELSFVFGTLVVESTFHLSSSLL